MVIVSFLVHWIRLIPARGQGQGQGQGSGAGHTNTYHSSGIDSISFTRFLPTNSFTISSSSEVSGHEGMV